MFTPFLVSVAGGFVGAILLNIVRYAIVGRITDRRTRAAAVEKRRAMAVSDEPINHRDLEAKSNEIRARQAMNGGKP